MSGAPWLLMVLWAAWVLQSAISALRARAFARLLARKVSPEDRAYRPEAVVVVPCKGVDPELEATVRSVLAQDYPAYRVVFVVESESDPAHALIARLSAGHAGAGTRLLVAGRAPPNVIQKLHNQLAALDAIEAEGRGEAAWAFLDSDAVPGPTWLGDMVGPLRRHSRNAVCTGYRWLVPKAAPGQARPGVCSELASVMNASVAVLQGIPGWSQVWGGSMAMLADTARAGDLRGRWRNALTDDYPATDMSLALGKRVHFVPRCLLASPVSLDLRALGSFVRRQYLITRVHAPLLYGVALALTWLYVAGWASAWGYAVHALVTDPAGGAWQWPALAVALVWAGNRIRASARRRCVHTAFDAATIERLETSLRLDRRATAACMLVHAVLITSALFGRGFTWRGHRYHLPAGPRARPAGRLRGGPS